MTGADHQEPAYQEKATTGRTAPRWQQIKSLLETARAQPVDARAAWLERACGLDQALHAEVVSLLEADARSLPWLDGDVVEAVPALFAEPGAPQTPARAGPYALVRELGRGGMGAVYLGSRVDEQFQQEVAVKLIKRGMDSDEIVARFRRERQILASIAHPNISRLLDGGMTCDGQPYLVMERIEGEPIDHYCTHHQLSIPRRLALFRAVCDAVHHAHGCLVVHRDIKPGNVLVTAEGVPKLLDFGVAKLLGADHVPGRSTVTNGAVPLTADYASPEQLRGDAITTASDVYALGVVLYELLAGRRPYRLTGLGRPAAERQMCETDPPLPSAVAEVVGDRRQQKRWRRQLAGDLDKIVAKALHKEPRRRYASAAQLAEDLRRHQVGLPVIARPDTLLYQAGKLARRHRVFALAAGLVALSLVLGLVTTSWQARIARAERERAREEAATATEVADFLAGVLQETDPFGRQGEEMSVPALLDRAATRIEEELRTRPRVRARVLETLGVALGRNDALDQAKMLLDEALTIRLRVLGPQAPETAKSLSALGALLRRTGDLAEAEAILRRALTIHQAHDGAASVGAAAVIGELASVLRERGAFDQATPLARRSLAVRRARFGDGTVEVAEARNDLALLLTEIGDLAGAEPLYREALAIYRARYGEHHLTVGISLQNLSDLLLRQGRIDLAIESMQQSLAIARAAVGGDSSHLASGLNTLGVLLRRADRLDEARDAYQEALDLQRRLLGADHPSVATTSSNLGATLMAMGDLAGAEARLARALAILRRQLGEEHPSMVPSLHLIGQLRLRQERPADAEAAYRQALAIARLARGPDHPQVASVLVGLGRAQLARGDAWSAEGTIRRALAIRQAVLGADHAAVASAKSWLGACLAAQQRHAEAEPLLVAGHQGLLANRGAEHSSVKEAWARLQALYQDRER